MTGGKLDLLFKSIGDPTRLRLLNLLRFGKICVGDLQSVLAIPQPTISRHLAVLRGAGLVIDSRRGTRIFYGIARPELPQIEALRDLLDKCCPLDEQMWADFERFEIAIRSGKCHVESDEAIPGLPQNSNSNSGSPEV